MQSPNSRRLLWNALFTLVVLAIGGFGVLSVARRSWRWQDTFHARAAFPTIAGVENGARVLVQGMNAGVVESVQAPAQPGGPVVLVLRLDTHLRHLIRSDATARITTQGVVGSRVVELVPGAADAPLLADNAMIRAERPVELADLLARATRSFDNLDAVTVAAREGLGEINAIAASVRAGEGTLGRLVRDEEAYNHMIALSTQGEKTLANLEDNLDALKGTWPISSYFRTRGFNDAGRVLFQPGARRESRVLASDDLFEPGRAVLTGAGRTRLDEIARWFKTGPRPESTRMVVAAFTDRAPQDKEELAQILTQEQAEAIRDYLVNAHAIDHLPWYRFTRRSVAAIGYGTHLPEAAELTPGPPRRVEIILFTPQQS